jgi:hypothetical protein
MLICSISKYGEISDDFFLKIKQSKFLDGHITYQSHMSILLTMKFCQPSHEFTFGVGMTFVSYPLVLTPLV